MRRNSRPGSSTIEEFQFKVTARRNRLLGLWAAQQLGLLGEAAEAYGKASSHAQFEPGGDKSVIDKVAADLGAKDPTYTRPASTSNSSTSPSRPNSS